MKNIFYGWWIVLAGFFIGLYVAGTVFFGFTAFIEPIRREFGWSYTQISFAASLRGLEMGIFAPFVGFVVDRFGPRKLIVCGSITVGLGLILFSYTQSLIMYYGSFLLITFGAGGCTSVVTFTAVAQWFDKNLGKALGMMASGFGAGGLLVPVIVQLIDNYGWRNTLIILGLGMLFLGVPLSLLIRDKPKKYDHAARTRGSNDVSPTSQMPEPEVQLGLMDALKNPSFRYINLAETIRFMAIAAVATHVMPYLHSLGMARSTAGLVAAGIPLFSIIGRLGFGWLSDLYDKRHVMALSYGFMGIGLLVFVYVQRSWLAVLFLLIFSPGFGGGMVLRAAIVTEYFGAEALGKLLGIMMGFASIGGLIGPILAGWMFDTTSSYQSVWIIFIGIISLATFLIFRIKKQPVRTQVSKT